MHTARPFQPLNKTLPSQIIWLNLKELINHVLVRELQVVKRVVLLSKQVGVIELLNLVGNIYQAGLELDLWPQLRGAIVTAIVRAENNHNN
jgi:hypothetical protein